MNHISENQKLIDLHSALLKLHKSLLEHVKIQFESVYGKIQTPHDYLSIVMNHDAFAWLRTLSELIVSIDEASEGKEDAKTEEEFIAFTQELLSLGDGEFAKKYAGALQDSPEVTHAHGGVMAVLKR